MATSERLFFYFRSGLEEEGEFEALGRALREAGLPDCLSTSRMVVPMGSVVVARYSALPFYKELVEDLGLVHSRLVNSWRQHQWIADVLQWGGPGGALEGMTPRSYSEWHSLPEGSYVVKGKTNSRKNKWDTMMFAPTREDIPHIARALLQDSLIVDQGLVVREYHPLKKLDEGLNGLPITNEWRTFWYRGKLLASGFYWASHEEVLPQASFPPEALAFAQQAADRVKDYADFYVLDLAEKADGTWIVIEVNDGQMSGLSMVDPSVLYPNLIEAIRADQIPIPSKSSWIDEFEDPFEPTLEPEPIFEESFLVGTGKQD